MNSESIGRSQRAQHSRTNLIATSDVADEVIRRRDAPPRTSRRRRAPRNDRARRYIEHLCLGSRRRASDGIAHYRELRGAL
eukprot:6114036-Pleurochrysis_carterae.AAC.2